MNTRFSEPVESLLSSTRAIKGLLLSVLLFACALSLRAQTSGGTVNFANNNSVPVINGGTGAAITTANGVQAALYWAPTNFGALAQIGATAVVGVPLPGLFAAGTRTSGAATPGGATGKFQVFAWSGGYQTYEEAIQHAGVLVGHSAILNVPTGNPTGDPPTPPASLVANGLQSIVLMTNVVSVCAPPTSGMISSWRGEDNGLDSIDGNHGTLVGDTTFGPGMVGQALVFDGSGDKLLVGNPANLQLQNFTIEGWVKRASATIASYGFDGEIFGYGSLGYCLGIRNNSSLFLTKVDISEVALTQAVTDTNWHHVAVTKAGTVVVFYVDGAARVTTNYNTTFVFNTPAAVGNRGDTGLDCSFLGAVDELAIYGRALSAAEILAIYSASSAGKCLVSCTPAPPGMVSWWRGKQRPGQRGWQPRNAER